MTDRITYSRLDAVLQQLGFSKSVEPGKLVGYRHDASDTILLYRRHRPADAVPVGSLAATRRLLVDRGLVTPDEWDAMLHSVAA